MWFYTWFILLAIAVLRLTPTTLFVLTISTVIFAFFFQLVALFYLAIWCFGLLALAYRRWPQWLPGPIIAFIVSLGLASSSVTQTSIFGASVRLSDLAVGLSFAWLINVLKDRDIPVLMRMRGVNHRLSDVSYSLYVIHFPMMLLICGALAGVLGLETQLPRGLLPTDWRAISLYVGFLGCVLVFVFAFAWVFERRTGDVRRFVKKALLDRVSAT